MEEREIIEITEFQARPLLVEDYIMGPEYEEFVDDGEFKEDSFWANFEKVEEDMIFLDLEKSYAIYRVIVKRLSDGKFFEGDYSTDISSYFNFSSTLSEVFEEKITTVIYN